MKLKGKTFSKEVLWAARYILDKTKGREVHSEQVVSIMRGEEEITFGSVDAYCEGELFDLKTGRMRDYGPQMAAYALGIMQRYDLREVTYHIVYSKYREAHVEKISLEQAMDTVYSIVDSVNDPTRSPCYATIADGVAGRKAAPPLRLLATASEVRLTCCGNRILTGHLTQPLKNGCYPSSVRWRDGLWQLRKR